MNQQKRRQKTGKEKGFTWWIICNIAGCAASYLFKKHLSTKRIRESFLQTETTEQNTLFFICIYPQALLLYLLYQVQSVDISRSTGVEVSAHISAVSSLTYRCSGPVRPPGASYFVARSSERIHVGGESRNFSSYFLSVRLGTSSMACFQLKVMRKWRRCSKERVPAGTAE